MTFRQFSRRQAPRWLGLLVVLLIAGMLTSTTALAAPSFTFQTDDQGANDEPGQKDLTAQASAVDSVAPNHFYTAWKWDDVAWNGNNTGDGCSLFDTNDDGFVEYAACASVQGKNPVTFVSVTLYSCNNKWADRCGNPVPRYTTTASGFCTVTDKAPGSFDSEDTLIVCDITALAAAATPPITDLTGGTLLNTCSYPSREPNSDPSDCVLTPTAVNTSVATLSSATWSVTLKDTATISPAGATGSVVFKLWNANTAGVCSGLVWTSPSITLDSNSQATTAGVGTPSNGNTITNLTVDADGIYYWTVDYTPTGLFNASSSVCGATGETIQINIPVTTTS